MLAAFSRLSLRALAPSVSRRVLNLAPATRAFSVSRPTFHPASTTKTRTASKAKPKSSTSKKASAEKKKTVKKATKTAAAKKPTKKPAKKAIKKPAKPATIKLNVEDKPPSPPGSPFVLFFRKYYQGADLSRTEDKRAELMKLTSEAGRVWKSLSEHEKQAFRDEHKTSFADYEKRREVYYKTVSPAILKEINRRRVKKSKRKIHIPHALRPVRPLSPYIMYVKDQRSAMSQGVQGWEENIAVTKDIAARWTALPEADKKPYRDRYVDAMKAHREARA